MTSLDQPDTYSRHDPSGMHNRIAGLPDQCWRAWQECMAFHLPTHFQKVKAVAVLGMGGSAIGGDLVAGLASLEDGLPVTVVRSYDIPTWVGPGTLAIVCSYSGDTEETLSMYRQARKRGACVVAATRGGTLARLAQEDDTPLFRVEYQGEPRSALGYSFLVPLAILCKLGLLQDKTKDVAEAVQVLREATVAWSFKVPASLNLAKTVAGAMNGRLPVIYGAGFLAGAARRWKTQLNENSKVWAFWEELSELNHNAIEGYTLPKETNEQAFVVLLYSPMLHPRVSLRYAATEELLGRSGVSYRRLEGIGQSPLAHLLNTIMLGDYVSYYLAMLNQVDPALSPAIDLLKGRLAAQGDGT